MKVSRNWLQTFFDAPLPSAEVLAEALTFHSSEIEEVVTVGDDAVLDVKVLPDKSAWMLSHRGVAKELSTILELPMTNDPLLKASEMVPDTDTLTVVIDTPLCARYAAAHVKGVTVGQSPPWLVERLTAIGQRSINNVVDATNYVMFHTGQPLHAFDAGKLGTGARGEYAISVRPAVDGEHITTLTGEEYTLTTQDLLIVDGTNNEPIGIAGVKGGKRAAVDASTTDIVIESANFDRVSVRKTSVRHKLRTDASTRYENGVVPELASIGLVEVVHMIRDIAGGTLVGYVDEFPSPRTVVPVVVPIGKINSVLGLTLSESEVATILNRFGYETMCVDGVFSVAPPYERDDLVIAEDVIEEIGRMHGLMHIPSAVPGVGQVADVSARFFYTEQIRDALLAFGFSEVYTSSFNKQDVVQLENALASDKGYLRSALRSHVDDALVRNVLNKDLLGLTRIALFEIGSVFTTEGEHLALSFGVRTGVAYKAKTDDPLMKEAIATLTDILGTETYHLKEGIAEINIDEAIADLPTPTSYASYSRVADAAYVPFSVYPFVSRDIALWTAESGAEGKRVLSDEVCSVIEGVAGTLLVRTTLFDEFTKEGRTSYAFRLIFQSHERTLSDGEVNEIMEKIHTAMTENGWEVR